MRRAFVVQLIRGDAEEGCEGRIEHVDSGRSKHFHSLGEAISFVRKIDAELKTEEHFRGPAQADEVTHEHPS